MCPCKIKLIIILVLVICICTQLCGCWLDNAPYKEDYINGTIYGGILEGELYNLYGVEFSKDDTPAVSVIYSSAGVSKTAGFKLDGYDENKRIGYKIVFEEDVAQWNDALQNGDTNIPDIKDADLIQAGALNYEFPVIFLCAYQYQEALGDRKANEISYDEIFEILDSYRPIVNSIVSSPEIKRWAQDGMYSGEWIKERLEEAMKKGYGISFSHENLPVVYIKYAKSEAVFQLDGYDEKRQIGYKFVTEADRQNWERKLAAGDKQTPDLSRSYDIKQAALYYEFPVLFIYVPKYWKTTINEIFNDEPDMNAHVVEWLEKHK